MMVWTVLGTFVLVIATIAWAFVLDTLLGAMGLSTGLFAWLFARGIWQFAGSMENKGFNDPVYKKNLKQLIERHRQFEDVKE